MLSIRFARKGKKAQPFFRVVVQQKTKSPKSNFIESLGFYNPKTKEVKLNAPRVQYWFGVGGQATVSLKKLLKKQKITA